MSLVHIGAKTDESDEISTQIKEKRIDESQQIQEVDVPAFSIGQIQKKEEPLMDSELPRSLKL